MPRRRASLAVLAHGLALATLASCIPELESSTVDRPYPLRDFDGPDTVPAAPPGTLSGFDLTGPWRIVGVEHQDGDPAVDHIFQPGWVLLAQGDFVRTVQGVPPEALLPAGFDWRRNSIDDSRLVLGFGFRRPRGDLSFMHYAFVMAATDETHARAIEAIHFENAVLGTIVWSIWTVELERLPKPPDQVPVPPEPIWPR